MQDEWRMNTSPAPAKNKHSHPTGSVKGGGGSKRMDVLDVVIYNLPSKKNNIPKKQPYPA